MFGNRSVQRIRLQHATLIEEYRTLRSEVVADRESLHQITQLALTAIGVLIAITPFIIQLHARVLFLVAPLLLYALTWIELRLLAEMVGVGDYLRLQLIPQIREVVMSIDGSTRGTRELLQWETISLTPALFRQGKRAAVLFLPIAGVNIPVTAGLLSMAGFGIIAVQERSGVTVSEWGLLALDSVIVTYTAACAIRIIFR